MINYFNTLCSETKEYFKILEPEPPEFLNEYLEAPELIRIDKISMFCGKDYSASFGVEYPISNLAHSVGVALIIWHFTHDKKQTLAGLFHDIATPVFKHCIDYMMGDSEGQEATEEQTESILFNSKHIIKLLKRDGIDLSEVKDYKSYPLADSPMPRLSADRFEYTFSCGLSLKRIFDLNKVKYFYENVVVETNEFGEEEFAFKSVAVAEQYLKLICNLWPEWCNERNNVYMQFLADMCGSVSSINKLSIEQLYSLSEKEVLKRINNCKDKYLEGRMKMFQTHKNIYVSDEKQNGKYCVKINSKRRYISPLAKTESGVKRAVEVSPIAKACVEEYLNKKFDKFGCLDFDFVPYKKV